MNSEAEAWRLLQGCEIGSCDPLADAVLRHEEARQRDKLILIPSESMAPLAVRAALGSVFTNLYAEGYPALRTLLDDEELLADLEMQAALHRRYADRRYYKGTEFADLVETLAARRVAQLFATDGDPAHGAPVRAEEIHANVQALSGAAANNAAYEACLEPGDTIMGMSLSHGGHLTHGSPYNRSGRYYRVVSYGVSADTGRLDYGEIERQALECKPKLIVAGASAYPWDIDWRRLRQVADQVPGRAYLMADIAHPAGLVVAGLFPNPIGYADVVTFTTHKTLIGPRGAVILCTDEALGRRIDRAVFPGEQGGPHMNNIAAMAVAFKIAQTAAFRALQRRIVDNAVALARGLRERGLRLAYGGTNTHLLLIDLNAVKTASGVPLKGDVVARILDLCGVVCNKNTIPGDLTAAHSSAIRLGTVWVSQRGLDQRHMDRLAGVIQSVVDGIQTFRYAGSGGSLWRGKIELPTLREASAEVRRIVAEADGVAGLQAAQPAGVPRSTTGAGPRVIELRGPRASGFLQEACTADVMTLRRGSWERSFVADANGDVLADVLIARPESDGAEDGEGEPRYWVLVGQDDAERLRDWFEALSDGYVVFDRQDLLAKVQGPVVVRDLGAATDLAAREQLVRQAMAQVAKDAGLAVAARTPLAAAADRFPQHVGRAKPYFVGQHLVATAEGPEKPAFVAQPYVGEPRRSCLYEEHLKLTAARNMIPFAGWTMPVWYTSIGEEHRAVREAAGLFDVSHMGVLEVRGEHATRFLDLVTTSYVPSLRPGQAQYAFLLDPNGSVIDDILIYCLAPDRYMLVVNAANAEKDKAWLDAVNAREVLLDRQYPQKAVDVAVEIRDLKAPSSGADRRVDLSLQGPHSLAILQKVVDDEAASRALARLRRSEFLQASVAGTAALISRTGYTGEAYGFELYVHPDRAPAVWNLLLREGSEFGIKPAGLGARDSTRTEAGLPLYGHELAGPYDVTPAEAGYASFVKLHKPFFVGRRAFGEREARSGMTIVRFRLNARGVRMAKTGDPVVSKRGECIGYVTSAAAVEGVQIGMAYVDRRYEEEGTAIGIFPLPRERGRQGEPAKADLKLGDRLLLHEEATVLSRFPARQARGQ